MIINSKTRHWNKKEDEIAFKRNQQFNFSASLAIECFADENNRNDIFKDEAYTLYDYLCKNEDNLSDEEAVKLSQEVSQKFNNLFDKLGRSHFTFYDDGEVNYIWELSKK